MHEEDERKGPFASWFSWAHAAVTIALAAVLYSVWSNWKSDQDDSANERLKLEARIVVLETNIGRHDAIDVERMAHINRELDAMNERLRVQRDDIRVMQQQLGRHVENGVPNSRGR